MRFDVGNVNEVSPYTIEWEEGANETLLFHTMSGYEYNVSFVRDTTIFDGLETYQLSFFPKYGEHSYDANIRIVICLIIEEFLSANDEAIIYVTRTDKIDGKCRSRLFLQWFAKEQERSGDKYIVKTIGERAGLIICKNNPMLKEYLEAVEDLRETLEK
ncbi:MAG: hypothetical protein J6C56_04775 [Alistipes sp.]|nr:hypothetical protein [Alistipes sp.]